MSDSAVTRELLLAIKQQYRLPWQGVHGVTHWARVRENGLRLAQANPGSVPRVIELFSVFHDSRRVNEGIDRGHGKRGAELARKLRGSVYDLADREFELLLRACTDHTNGQTVADVTVQCCWDGDRLDLWRVGIKPAKEFLCTAAAKQDDTIAWANQRAARRAVPDIVALEWMIYE